MAILEGGIFSNPRGKTGGIVFGAARTRTGKKVTSRLLVPPSNPNSAAQVIQRGKFAESLAIVRLIGSGIYQGDFNRAIGQLPGFQSMTSIYLNSMDAISDIGTIPPINLGSLHKPDTFGLSAPGPTGEIQVDWSAELGLNGTDADISVAIGVSTSKASSPLERLVVLGITETRMEEQVTLAGFASAQNVSVIQYFRGAGAADGLLSPTSFAQGNAAA